MCLTKSCVHPQGLREDVEGKKRSVAQSLQGFKPSALNMVESISQWTEDRLWS